MINYVCGFLTDTNMNYIVLIRKKRPSFAMGRLNFPGGKIEINETPIQAMTREFREETGLQIENWHEFCQVVGSDHKIHFFWEIVERKELIKAKTMTDEYVDVYTIQHLNYIQTMPNMEWQVPMAISCMKHKRTLFKVEQYELK